MDNRSGEYNGLTLEQVKKLCDRRFGIGADGLMLLNKKEGYDFEMVYFNSDGKPSSMCGNGGRCLVRFAYDIGIKKFSYSFIATDGPHEAEIDNKIVRLKMKDVSDVDLHSTYAILDTGSPHYVKFSTDVRAIDVYEKGREIRYSRAFEEKGINVNFVEHMDDDDIFVRTYERGVEDETLSCGTGVTASALVSSHNDKGFNHVKVLTPGGKLSVEFNKVDKTNFTDIWLCGPAVFVFKGTTDIL